jgi:hypothetical protein
MQHWPSLPRAAAQPRPSLHATTQHWPSLPCTTTQPQPSLHTALSCNTTSPIVALHYSIASTFAARCSATTTIVALQCTLRHRCNAELQHNIGHCCNATSAIATEFTGAIGSNCHVTICRVASHYNHWSL